MSRLLGLTLLMLGAQSTQGQSNCRYANAPVNVLTAGDSTQNGLCSPSTTACIVDKKCKEVWNTTASNLFKFTNVNRLGDVSQYALAALEIQNCTEPFTFDPSYKLPDRLNTFALENCQLTDNNFPNITWPEKLNELYLGKNQLHRSPTKLPSSMSELWLNDNLLTEVPKYPEVTKILHVARNNIIQLSGYYSSMSKAKKLHLTGNPIAHIRNVYFSSALILFNCDGCAITTFEISRSSLDVLNQLGAYNADNETGFLVRSISFNATSCQNIGGEQGLLQNQYPVCVTDPIRSTPSSSSTSSSSSTLFIMLGIAFVALILVGCYCCCSSIAKSQSTTHQEVVAIPVPAMAYAQVVDATVGVPDPMADLVSWKIAPRDVAYMHRLAQGASGEVWLGEYQQQRVAIKKMVVHKQHDLRAQLAFVDEIKLLSRLRSACIVRLIGVSWTNLSDVQCLVEFMDQCDLKEFLAKTNPMSFGWPDKLRVASSIAEALAYLHTIQIIHRDIKSKNVLLDSKKGAKLADFGVSRDENEHAMTAGIGTPRWTAPEVLSGSQYTVAADIYSFGMVLSELDSHATPFRDEKSDETGLPLTDSAIVALVIQGKLTPKFSSSCPQYIRDLALRCVARNPSHRPTANEIVLILRQTLG
ncbi:hypothetical protein AeRB84_015781 [Aphanomyces euteiches]|nr:hypothetical protein AeRB84_015781 [Aphanomyces euteiches]